jgi:two-component system phosphate regulon response regulator OmpR
MKGRTRLLLVDHDPSALAPLRDYLEGHGFEVAQAACGEQVPAAIERERPDAVLLDVDLAGEDRFLLARRLREHYDVGILMVSSSPDVVERIVGLELGADDYITRPYDLRELLARIRTIVRRLQSRPAVAPAPIETRPAPAPRPLRAFGRCTVDLEAHRMFDADGAEVTLTAMEYELVSAFLANPNRVLTRDQLLMKARNREWEPFDRSIDIRIGRLRRKVETLPDGEPRVIRTVRNAGYMFVPGEGGTGG